MNEMVMVVVVVMVVVMVVCGDRHHWSLYRPGMSPVATGRARL